MANIVIFPIGILKFYWKRFIKEEMDELFQEMVEEIKKRVRGKMNKD
ncbi:MAG TPA: hypothetical protein VMW04_03895 [Patescibacteria group bacterium]|nr:hypothetical protein [Patescibacteria group bacterium]